MKTNSGRRAVSRTDALVGDYYFDHSPEDVKMLGNIAQISSAMHAPFIAVHGAVLAGHGYVAGIEQSPRPDQDFSNG
jgi:predicted component of type VI protein secretion system